MRILETDVKRRRHSLVLIIAIVLFAAASARALLPEPDKILYGTITIDGSLVSSVDTQYMVEVYGSPGGELLGSYRLGDNGDVQEGACVIELTLEFLSPNEDAEILIGDDLTLVLRNGTNVVEQVGYSVTNRSSSRIDFDSVLDTDGDGIPDWWEDDHFGGPTNATASAHSDADGFTDGEEYVADTDPLLSTSYLRIIEIDLDNDSVTFMSSTGRIYSLQCSDNSAIGDFAWSNLCEEVWGTNTMTSLQDTNGLQRRVYRITVKLPPEN